MQYLQEKSEILEVKIKCQSLFLTGSLQSGAKRAGGFPSLVKKRHNHR